MAWDKSLPRNSTKLRNYPTVLNANFSAVEEGADSLQIWKANFIERNAIPSAPPVTPARIDDTMQIFSKQNPTDGETDLFVLDDRASANTIQLTENGYLGGLTQAVAMDSFTFDGTRTFNENNIVSAYGFVTSGGSLSYGSGVASVTHGGTGLYTLNWAAGRFSNTNYAVVIIGTTNSNGSWNGTTKTTGAFGLEIRQSNNGTLKDSGFFFLVAGGQA